MMKQNSGMHYDVFINHRGPDVKNSLASLIYNQLKTKEPTLRVFLDIKEIPCGVDFSYAIETAIQSSSVHIAIFSKRYAESKWCLHELDLIIKSKRKLIPIFCDVNPASLRRIEKGCYQKAFEKHRGREPLEKTKRWEDALARASYLQGLPFKMKESDHWEFVEKIVSIVLMNLKDGPSIDDKYPVTPEQAVEEFPASATELEDLGVCQEFITEKFALARGLDDDRLDLSEPSGADGPAVSELFEDEDGLAIRKLFEPDDDGLATGLDDDRLDIIELSGVDGPTLSELFGDEDGLAIRKLFEPDDDGPVRGKLFDLDEDVREAARSFDEDVQEVVRLLFKFLDFLNRL